MAIDFPSSPTLGQQYSYAGVTYTYTAAGVWAGGTGPGGGGGIVYTASSTAPVAPNPGDLWYDLLAGMLLIYIDDGVLAQWMQIELTVLPAPTPSTSRSAMLLNATMVGPGILRQAYVAGIMVNL